MPDGTSNKAKLKVSPTAFLRTRHLAQLRRAYVAVNANKPDILAANAYWLIHGAVFAAFPGMQDDANAADALSRAVKSGAASIRRRGVNG